MKQFVVLGLAMAALLVACPGQSVSGGRAKVLSSVSQPDLNTCPVIRGQYIAIKGENFGTAADWTSGQNKLIFNSEVSVSSPDVELTQAGSPATLLVKVPAAAVTGPLVVEVAGVRSDPINVTVNDFTPNSPVGECRYPASPTPSSR